MERLKDKVEHFVEYYLLHMIVGVIVIVFLIIGINKYLNRENEILSIRLITTDLHVEEIEEIERKLTEDLIKNKQDVLVIEGLNPNELPDSPETALQIQKTAAEITAREIDILLLDEEMYSNYDQDGQLYNLNHFSQINEIESTGYYPSESSSVLTGINISNLPYFSFISMDKNPLIFSVPKNSEKLNEIEKFINLLIE